jgi:hypothetical protein
MLPPAPVPVQEPLLLIRRRPPALALPDDPSPEELAQYWTLSPRDKAEGAKGRGASQRRRFAVQLCPLRTYGRFLPKAVAAPVAITNYRARQVDLPLGLFGEIPERLATETDHGPRIQTSLGWQPFDDAARRRLTRWLTQRATDDVLPSALVSRAAAVLRSWQILLPAPSTLEALVASVTVRVQEEVSTRRATALTPALQRAIDDRLQGPSGARAVLLQLKAYPPEANPAVLLRSIERYHVLQQLGVDTIDVSRLRPPMLRSFAAVAKRDDARALRRFAPAKRYPLMACFLVESHQTMLDHLVALHDQLLTKKRREAPHAFDQRSQRLRRQYRRG